MGNTEQRPWERPKERVRVPDCARVCWGSGFSHKTPGTALGRPRSLEPAAILDLADIV